MCAIRQWHFMKSTYSISGHMAQYNGIMEWRHVSMTVGAPQIEIVWQVFEIVSIQSYLHLQKKPTYLMD